MCLWKSIRGNSGKKKSEMIFGGKSLSVVTSRKCVIRNLYIYIYIYIYIEFFTVEIDWRFEETCCFHIQCNQCTVILQIIYLCYRLNAVSIKINIPYALLLRIHPFVSQNNQNIKQSVNTAQSVLYKIYHRSPIWNVIHHTYILCTSLHEIILQKAIFNFLMFYTHHYIISLFNLKF